MDADIIGVDTDRTADIIGAEGGELACFPSYPLCSVSVQPSTDYTRLGRLTIVTGTGTTITRTLAIDPGILGELENTTTLQISVMVSTPPLTGSEGDVE